MTTQIQSKNWRIPHLSTVTYYLPTVTYYLPTVTHLNQIIHNYQDWQLWQLPTVTQCHSWQSKMDNYHDRQLWQLATVTNVTVGSQNVTVGASYNNLKRLWRFCMHWHWKVWKSVRDREMEWLERHAPLKLWDVKQERESDIF